MRSAVSAGLLLFRRRGAELEFLLVHPGRAVLQPKDEGAWSIPKGEAAPDEGLLTRARIEFTEELGCAAPTECFPLGSIRQKGGKTVHAWGCESDLPAGFTLSCNTFELEWPPRSGKRQTFPEIDRAEFFPYETARRKINPEQLELLDRLRTIFSRSG